MDTRIDKFGIQFYGLAVVTKGLAPLLLFLCYLPEVEIRCRCLGVNLQDILELDRGLVVILFLILKAFPEVELYWLLNGNSATGQQENKK